MQVIPAMDLKSGKCVHSHEDGKHSLTVVSEDPVEVAARWIDEGATRLHLIDIDGFHQKEPVNVATARAIRKIFPTICLEVIGGVSCEDHVSIWLDSGVDYVVVSSRGVTSADYFEGLCAEFPDKIILSVDLLDGKWSKNHLSNRYGTELDEMAVRFSAEGLAGLVCTNSFSSNKNQHPASAAFLAEQLTAVPSNLEMPVFLNGVVQCLKDVEGVNQLKNKNIQGIIVGRAIYDDMIGYKTLQQAAN